MIDTGAGWWERRSESGSKTASILKSSLPNLRGMYNPISGLIFCRRMFSIFFFVISHPTVRIDLIGLLHGRVYNEYSISTLKISVFCFRLCVGIEWKSLRSLWMLMSCCFLWCRYCDVSVIRFFFVLFFGLLRLIIKSFQTNQIWKYYIINLL